MNATAVTALGDVFPSNMVRLGFGCGGLLRGDLSRRESLYLLETAIDCGITYFDTARLYGNGDAEGVLGMLVPRYRRKIIIASKAGILPPSRSVPLRIVGRAGKLLHKAVPPLKSLVPTPMALHPRVGVFDVRNLRRSVETSLRELRTDYLDILLLHECTEANVEKEELLYFLQGLQKDGKIRKFGLATGIEETIRIARVCPPLSQVVQIASSLWNMNIKRLQFCTGGLTITHSTLTSRFHELTRRIASDDLLAKQWQSAIQIDPRNAAELAQLLLAHALHLNPNGIVLFFSNNPANIRANTKIATEDFISAGQIEGLNVLMKNKERMLSLEGHHWDYMSVS